MLVLMVGAAVNTGDVSGQRNRADSVAISVAGGLRTGVARFLAPVVGPSMIRSIIERSFLPRPVPDDFLASRVALWNGPQHIVTWAEQRVSGPDDVAALVLRYGTLDRPVHLVHGAEDALVPIEGADRLRALLPRSELVVLGATGHYVQYVQPQELVKVVRRAARAE